MERQNLNFLNNNQSAVFSLGGQGEVGKNMYAVQFQDDIIILDSGVQIPDKELLGVDYIIPDYSYIKQNKENVRGIFITSGKYIDGLPYLLKDVDIPVYGGDLTIKLIKRKLKEHGLSNRVNLISFNETEVIKLSKISVKAFRTTQSIPDSFGLIVKTPNGNIVYTGDFRFDFTLPGHQKDVTRMAEIGKEGVLCLLSDSVNSAYPGYSISEAVIKDSIKKEIYNASGRVIVTTDPTNITRIIQIIETSIEQKRKVIVCGKEMEGVLNLCMQSCLFGEQRDIFVKPDRIKEFSLSETTILCTSTQGKNRDEFSFIVNGKHRHIKIRPDDTVIFAYLPEPRYERQIYGLVDELIRAGAHVIQGVSKKVFTSDHAYQEEQKLLLKLMRPTYFVPVHGDYSMLLEHANTAKAIGVECNNIFVLENGEFLTISKKNASVVGKVPTKSINVDGKGIGDVGNIVLRERQTFSKYGVVIVILSINKKINQLNTDPEIISRGFVYMKESQELLKSARQLVVKKTEELLEYKITEWSSLKRDLSKLLSTYFFEKTKRKPMILPIILETK